MELQKHYDANYPSLPGFGPDEAHRTGSWTLDDYADWLQGEIIEQRCDAVIGYSFGCAVATHGQFLHRSISLPLILLSPAVARAYGKSPNKALILGARILKHLEMERVVRFLRKHYLTHVVKNPHVMYGTPFLQSTYSNIISIDLSSELAQLIDAGYAVKCIFGSEDTATPPETLFLRTPAARPLSFIIPNGTHNIGSTHPREVVEHIIDFLKSLKV